KDISLNHIMFGEISAWFYKALGGIKPDPSSPGFKNILLTPHFVEGLTQFKASHTGPYGTIVSSWKRTANKITYRVTVPPNSTATLTFTDIIGKRIYESGKPLNANSEFLKASILNGQEIY